MKNTGNDPISLENVSFTDGVIFNFATAPPAVQTLTAGQYVLVVSNQSAFEARYGTGVSDRIAGEFVDSGLSNGGETVELVDTYAGTIARFDYNDGYGWPLAADGGGHSLIAKDSALEDEPLGTLDYGGNWHSSAYRHGSPAADDPGPVADVVLNEIMAHTD